METKKILIVIDMQNDFIDGSLGTKEAQAIVPKVCEKIKNWDGEVIFTRDTHHEDYLKTQEGINLPVEHCIVGTNGWLINDYVMSSYLDTFDEKHNQNLNIINKDTFGSKNLPYLIDRISNFCGCDITLIGLCTDICVISNALLLKAHFCESEITVDASCCAGVTPESHKNALNAMKMCQIKIENE